MNTDISDEAAVEFSKRSAVGNFGHICMLDGWRECRGRAEAMMEERERAAFEACWKYVDSEVSKMITADAAYRTFKENK